MRIEKCKLENVLIIHLDQFVDLRGYFVETYNEKIYQAAGIDVKFVQDDMSVSRHHVFRGIHGDDGTWKLIDCLFGEIYFVVVDPQTREWQSFILSPMSGLQILIPPKFGNGYLVLSDWATFHYKQSTCYGEHKQFTIKYNDPLYHIYLPIKNPILSERDA
jgi:dTDP-4-dehydrorhamnose 3,5-epimerase